jgi:hypothetical protein
MTLGQHTRDHTHTHIHTYTQTDRERERQKQKFGNTVRQPGRRLIICQARTLPCDVLICL